VGGRTELQRQPETRLRVGADWIHQILVEERVLILEVTQAPVADGLLRELEDRSSAPATIQQGFEREGGTHELLEYLI
jgi:hypothetical protein